MNTLLLAIFTTIFLATLLNVLFKKFNVSHIVGYIFTGTIISYLFDFNTLKIDALAFVSELGIVFLMFTIGLELSFAKIKKMKETLFVSGALQMGLTTLLFYIVSFFMFGLDTQTSIIIALAFSLSSTAIIMPYLQMSKDSVTPYGKNVVGVLIFQDLAVIPILLLITFLSQGSDVSVVEVTFQIILALVFIILFVFYIGDKIVQMMLDIAAKTQLEEIFLGAIFTILLGMSVLTHEIGFSYSMGAFLAGVLIADTKFSMKVESDILSYKNLLLSVFFFSVGAKIDMVFLISHLDSVLLLFTLVILIKTVVVYFIAKRKNDKNTSAKTALALSSISGFAFVVMEIASSKQLISAETANLLIIVIFLTMVATPFILTNIYKLSSFFAKEFYESDVITPIAKKNHTIVVGFGTLGKMVEQELSEKKVDFIVISDNLEHVLLARELGFMSYFGHLNKPPVMKSLKVEESSSIILTVLSEQNKILIVDALKTYFDHANIIVKVDSDKENLYLKPIENVAIVNSNAELSSRLVELSLKTNKHI
jgi:CPA2 family monovalent cation:H+ antiporter-2